MLIDSGEGEWQFRSIVVSLTISHQRVWSSLSTLIVYEKSTLDVLYVVPNDLRVFPIEHSTKYIVCNYGSLCITPVYIALYGLSLTLIANHARVFLLRSCVYHYTTI